LVAYFGALAIFVFLEYVRALSLQPIGPQIHYFYKKYLDSRDQGVVVTTHIYLLLGCAIPLILASPHVNPTPTAYLAATGGVVILGIGDSAVRSFSEL
jgi:dolichol kinase